MNLSRYMDLVYRNDQRRVHVEWTNSSAPNSGAEGSKQGDRRKDGRKFATNDKKRIKEQRELRKLRTNATWAWGWIFLLQNPHRHLLPFDCANTSFHQLWETASAESWKKIATAVTFITLRWLKYRKSIAFQVQRLEEKLKALMAFEVWSHLTLQQRPNFAPKARCGEVGWADHGR